MLNSNMNGFVFFKTIVAIGSLLLVFLVISYFFTTVVVGIKINIIIPRFDIFSKNIYTLKYSEGNCTQDNQCKWAGKGCGGGHGICTDTPNKNNGDSTCEINENFPTNQGYSRCGCIISVKKCGWIK